MQDPVMQRLVPGPGEVVTVSAAYAAPLGGPTSRPWVAVCMISSLDGSTSVAGRSGALGGEVDRAILRQLRATADVIVVGSSTVASEGYGPPSKPGQRIGVVTARGNIDFDSELFGSGSGFVVTTTSADFAVPHDVDVVRAGDELVDLAVAIRRLPDLVPGCRTVQAEGGPTLNGALLAADVVDEVDLSTAPMMVGGDGPRLTRGAEPVLRRFELVQLTTGDDGYLFSRWRRHAADEP